MSKIGELVVRAEAEALYRLVLLLFKIPDRAMVRIVRAFYLAALPFVDKEEDLLQLQELERIFRAGPPLSDAVRRIFRDARKRQLTLTIRGTLLHPVRPAAGVTSMVRSLFSHYE